MSILNQSNFITRVAYMHFLDTTYEQKTDFVVFNSGYLNVDYRETKTPLDFDNMEVLSKSKWGKLNYRYVGHLFESTKNPACVDYTRVL